MYKYWTIQHKDVLEKIDRDGVYYPDFNQSHFVKKNPLLKGIYDFVLTSYNNVNGTNLEGLVFSFQYSEDYRVMYFRNYSEFKQRIREKRMAIFSLWKQYNEDEHVVMELLYDDDLNPLLIDINDFQVIMPPAVALPSYSKEELYNIVYRLRNGIIAPSVFPSTLIQAHLPYIKRENVKNVFPFFSLSEDDW